MLADRNGFTGEITERSGDGKVYPRLTHFTQQFMLHLVQRVNVATNIQEQIIPDVVAEKLGRVIANAGCRVFPQDPANSDSIVSIDPECELGGLASPSRGSAADSLARYASSA